MGDWFYDNIAYDVKRAVSCICCLVCAGPLLLIIGIIMLVTAPAQGASRQAEINAINAAIQQWTSTNRALYQNENFTIVPSGANNPPQNLQQSTQLESNWVSDVQSYVPLTYTTNVNWGTHTYDETYTVSVQYLNNGGSVQTVSGSVFVSQYNPQSSRSNSNNNNRNYCSGVQSYSLNTQCYTYYQLDHICVKFKPGTTVTSDNGIGTNLGCEYSDGTSGASGNGAWSPFHYRQITPSTSNSISAQVVARSTNDPYITAQYQTGGTMSLGLTAGQAAGIGLILLIIGAIFMIPCILITVLIVYCVKKRRNGNYQQDTVVVVQQPNVAQPAVQMQSYPPQQTYPPQQGYAQPYPQQGYAPQPYPQQGYPPQQPYAPQQPGYPTPQGYNPPPAY